MHVFSYLDLCYSKYRLELLTLYIEVITWLSLQGVCGGARLLNKLNTSLLVENRATTSAGVPSLTQNSPDFKADDLCIKEFPNNLIFKIIY